MADHLANIFGTEKDKHGDKCSRKHIKPTFSQTMLIPNIYLNPMHDPTNTLNEEQLQEHFDMFFEDMFTELSLKYGPLEDLNVCDNVGDHLLGNVYVRFKFEKDASKAVKDLEDRFYSGRPVNAELSPVVDFTESCCRMFEQGNCDRGGYCNFMHIKHPSASLKKELYSAQELYLKEKEAKARKRSRSRSRERRKSRSRSRRRSRSRSRSRKEESDRRGRTKEENGRPREKSRESHRERSGERSREKSRDRQDDAGREKRRESDRERRDRRRSSSSERHRRSRRKDDERRSEHRHRSDEPSSVSKKPEEERIDSERKKEGFDRKEEKRSRSGHHSPRESTRSGYSSRRREETENDDRNSRISEGDAYVQVGDEKEQRAREARRERFKENFQKPSSSIAVDPRKSFD